MREALERIAQNLVGAFEHIQNLEIQSTRGNVTHLEACMSAIVDSMNALQGIKIPDEEVREDV